MKVVFIFEKIQDNGHPDDCGLLLFDDLGMLDLFNKLGFVLMIQQSYT